MISVEVTIPHLYARVRYDYEPDQEDIRVAAQDIASLLGVPVLELKKTELGWQEDTPTYDIRFSVPAGGEDLRNFVRRNGTTVLYINML